MLLLNKHSILVIPNILLSVKDLMRFQIFIYYFYLFIHDVFDVK